MHFYNVTYKENCKASLNKDLKLKLGFSVAMVFCLVLVWVFTIILLSRHGALTVDEWILTISITIMAGTMLTLLLLGYFQDRKILKSIESGTPITIPTLRFAKVGTQSEFSQLYKWLMTIFSVLLCILTVVTFIIKVSEGNSISLFLVLMIFLSLCGLNATFTLHLNKKMDSLAEFEKISKDQMLDRH